jgi:predicted membrane-bound spermidine synthase
MSKTHRKKGRHAGVATAEPLAPAARHPSRVALISFLILFLELALIRFIPSEIKAISYFTNLLLFSAFFGLGLGCILWKREVSPYLFAAGLTLIFAFVMVSRGITVYETPGEVHYWLQADQRYKPFYRMPLVAAAFTVFSIAAVPFVTMGRALAREMQKHARLTAYGYDLIGSFLGTIVFALLSYFGTPPWVLIALTGSIWALTMCERPKERFAHVVAALAFLAFATAPYSWRWSPYYFVQYKVDANRITVWVNSSFHQEAINFQSEQPDFQPTAVRMAEKFALPYREYRQFHEGRSPEKILILGAGTGNDVNIALRNGVRDVTAVEIDPQIAAIGKELNPMRPYQDSAVRLVIDDGRHFLSNATDRYDMVLFGTLDSQTLLAGQTNLRLDNYIYTTECFKDARKVLKPGGMLAAYYSVFKPWFLGRIYATVASAFPGALQMHRMQDNYLFNTTIIAAKENPAFASDPDVDRQFASAIPSTDNWPYIYLEYPVISNLYLQVLGLIAAMIAAVIIILRKLERSRQYHLDFFFLGVGFSLMESAAIVRLALAFGSTWVVSAVVFACVLLTVFAANIVLERRPNIPTGLAWAALLVALAVNFLFPVQTLLGFSFPLRVLGAAALIGTPVFCAGICFSSLFKRETEVGLPFGMNMVGAMTGGSIEYLSMLMGMRNIWLVLVVVYALAFLGNRYKVRS